MQGLGFVILVGAFALFVLAQSRFVDAYVTRIGGASRKELQSVYPRHFRTYLSKLRRPPYTLDSYLRPVADALVEHRRRQLIASIVAVPCAAILAFLLSALDPHPPPAGLFIALVLAGGIAWGILFARSSR